MGQRGIRPSRGEPAPHRHLPREPGQLQVSDGTGHRDWPYSWPTLTSRGRASILEGWLQFGQAFHGGAGADTLILRHGDGFLVTLVIEDSGCHRHDLSMEASSALGACCPASTMDSKT